MADNKKGRDDQADDADRRQRERDMAAAVERADETEPPVDERALGDLEAAVESADFPATGADVVAIIGDNELESADGRYVVGDLIPDTDAETFEEPAAVRARVERPTVATAMKRIVEASDTLPNTDLTASQRNAYEKTFRALAAIDAVDEDEGIRTVADWIVERMRDGKQLPGSRAVRRQAAEVCRDAGYTVSNDEWLGV